MKYTREDLEKLVGYMLYGMANYGMLSEIGLDVLNDKPDGGYVKFEHLGAKEMMDTFELAFEDMQLYGKIL
jgi:hypothetical protein